MTKKRAAKIILDMINGAESTFGHSLSTVEINALKKGYCALNPEPTTNGERIRAMSDEELAEFMDNGCDVIAPSENCTKAFYDCKKCWLDWLKEEAKE